MVNNKSINSERLLERLSSFAMIGATPGGGVNRQALSTEDRLVRKKLAQLGIEQGFKVFQDAMANLFIRRDGKYLDSPPFLIGSHLDSQPAGGRFDGALGTLAAFEVLQTLEDKKIETGISLEVVAWTNEEGSRFAPGAMGSRAFSESKIPDAWNSVRDADGVELMEEVARTIIALPEVEMRPLGGPVAGYLELHIEQGPFLEGENIPIGIVDAIQGTSWLEVVMTGQSAHAGTTPLEFRRDPLVACINAIHVLNELIMPQDRQARFTIGQISANPGSINSIAKSVSFSVDLRHPDVNRLGALEDVVRSVCKKEAAACGCTPSIHKLFEVPPVKFSKPLLDTVERASRHLNIPFKRMQSGAFHDALFLARVAPSAMIFVPCRDGISHNESEFVEPRNILLGAEVLFETALEVTGNTKESNL